MKRPEILAPAGNMECLVAAVNAGCDAVYLAGKLYGARGFAGNFSNDEIIEAIKFCHLRGVLVYVTVNTIIYNTEVDELIKYIEYLYNNEETRTNNGLKKDQITPKNEFLYLPLISFLTVVFNNSL